MDDVQPLGPAGGAPTDPEAGLPADAGPSACLAVDRLRAGFGDLLAEPLGTLPDHRVREVTESSYQLLQSAHRVDDMTRDPPEDVPPETSDPPEAA